MSDDLTKKLADLGLDESAQEKARQAMGSVGGYVAAREERLTELIARTAGQVDERTDHRWTETIDKVRDGLLSGVSRLAEERPDPGPDPSDPDTTVPDPSGADTTGTDPTDRNAGPEDPPLS